MRLSVGTDTALWKHECTFKSIPPSHCRECTLWWGRHARIPEYRRRESERQREKKRERERVCEGEWEREKRRSKRETGRSVALPRKSAEEREDGRDKRIGSSDIRTRGRCGGRWPRGVGRREERFSRVKSTAKRSTGYRASASHCLRNENDGARCTCRENGFWRARARYPSLSTLLPTSSPLSSSSSSLAAGRFVVNRRRLSTNRHRAWHAREVVFASSSFSMETARGITRRRDNACNGFAQKRKRAGNRVSCEFQDRVALLCVALRCVALRCVALRSFVRFSSIGFSSVETERNWDDARQNSRKSI